MDPLIQSLVSLRWQDIVDILLNSYILFRLYVLFRGTNVIRMVIAIAMLWILERMAMSMGLIVTSWAMQGIIAAAALIIIIVFRNEIAGVLQARSLRSFFWGIPQRQIQTPIEIIVESVYELARHKLGALIVLPLKKGIESVVHGGIPWQGKLSREMLLSIFWHGTPVHDGATIIQGDQIVEVAAILPLSKSNDLPSHFGTRHRAAFGLAEKTDALVIVVSEERGEVTVFKDGAIINIEDSIDLDRMLREHAGTVHATKGARHQTMELGLAAMICLVSITSIWFSFARGFETFITMEVPVEFMNKGPKMELLATSASSVTLQLSGSGSLIRSVRPDQVKVKLDLANAAAGSNHIAIARDSIVLPPGIHLKQVEPQILKVNLDMLDQKKLPIQPDWSGKLPAGLILQDARVTPDLVKVTGGSLALKDIQTIYTEKIPLENITTDGKISVGLMLLPSYLKLDDESQNHVEVTYKIARKPPPSDDDAAK
ncbi:DisA protein [Desulfopila sp. IMCC35006]|uniref:diadenylate cyclase n=1 Tax=Desulfopila sp. IMCC35006 TaxID=2569542 RepID=UPI0010AD2265|nr:diadenylate cyclase [Desulfopila sp. IMCC35006]TKB25886.1 DisA protein [Desulfopila sp. IMCC35006]